MASGPLDSKGANIQVRPPHPAKVVQGRPPHAATILRRAGEGRPPHAATMVGRPPHPAAMGRGRPPAAVQRSLLESSTAQNMQAIIARQNDALALLAKGRNVFVMSDSGSKLEALTLKVQETAKSVFTSLYEKPFKENFKYVLWDWTKGPTEDFQDRKFDLVLARSMTCSCDPESGHFDTIDRSSIVNYNKSVHAVMTCGGATPENGLLLLGIVSSLLDKNGEAYLTNSSLQSSTGKQGRYYSYLLWQPIVEEFNKKSSVAATLVMANETSIEEGGFLGIHLQ